MTQLANAQPTPPADQRHPYRRPRDAATIILIDRSEPLPKVLLGRRHHGHKFMASKFVFPGGRVEPQDRHVVLPTRLDGRVEQRLMLRLQRPSAVKARAFAVAAIREVAEETGLLLGRKVETSPDLPDGGWADFTRHRVEPDLGVLRFIARAITPPGRPRRFDTRFFAADATAIAHRVDGMVGPDSELVELVWLTIAQAREIDIPPITRVVLSELERRIGGGFDHDPPVPFYRTLHKKLLRDYL
jgi:8-oxo-dGTP pyrophosphatase MutT (NUDIX family)